MPSSSRRTFLTALGTATLASFAGCGSSGSDELPAGSLQFVNDHELPHSIAMRVTGVGTRPGDGPNEVEGDPTVPRTQRELTATTVVQPGHKQSFEAVFTYDAWYGIEFTVDGDRPEDDAGLIRFNPAPTDQEQGSILGGQVSAGGDFSWVVTATENLGRFDN